jgi:hypothetical protein
VGALRLLPLGALPRAPWGALLRPQRPACLVAPGPRPSAPGPCGCRPPTTPRPCRTAGPSLTRSSATRWPCASASSWPPPARCAWRTTSRRRGSRRRGRRSRWAGPPCAALGDHGLETPGFPPSPPHPPLPGAGPRLRPKPPPHPRPRASPPPSPHTHTHTPAQGAEPSAPPAPEGGDEDDDERRGLLAGPSKKAGRGGGGLLAAPGSSAPGAAPPPPRRRPLVLPCGHSFCEPCISQWLSSKTTCPVCRKPIDKDEPEPSARQPPPPPPPGCQQQQQQQQQYQQRGAGHMVDDMLRMEMMYRLATLHRWEVMGGPPLLWRSAGRPPPGPQPTACSGRAPAPALPDGWPGLRGAPTASPRSLRPARTGSTQSTCTLAWWSSGGRTSTRTGT